MMSQPTIRKLLFLLSIFYALETHFISESSTLNIDLEEQTFSIDFQDLQVPVKQIDQAVSGLAQMDTTENRLGKAPGLDFDTLYFWDVQNQLNAHLSFHFSNQDNLFEMFNIQEDKEGNKVFESLEREKVIDANGEIRNTPQTRPTVYWDSHRLHLEVTVKRIRKEKSNSNNSTKSLLPAWKQWRDK